MTISELIIRLQCERKIHGDVACVVARGSITEFREVTRVAFERSTFDRPEGRESQTEACVVIDF